MTLHVIDTTTLSNFALIERPELIHAALKGEGATTSVVYAELKAGESLGAIPVSDWGWLPIIRLTSTETGLFRQLRLVLDDGEASCLAVAITRQAVLVTDDRQARRIAGAENILLSGTIGMLRILVRDGHLTRREANALLEEMITLGYRSPISNLPANED